MEFMPTISQALMRNPSFPLIVPAAQWKTPQYILASNQHPINHHHRAVTRTRASSIQIPFMGGTIVPSHEIDQHIQQKIQQVQRRRNSLPAYHTITEDRYGFFRNTFLYYVLMYLREFQISNWSFQSSSQQSHCICYQRGEKSLQY